MRTRFLTSASDASGFPRTPWREVAFVGRSNAGKSSLLNRVAGARVARTSKTPGRTQAVNFFEAAAGEDAVVLVDLPGYGYAEAPIPARHGWYRLLEAYLGGRAALAGVLLLVDVRRDPGDEDREVLAWLRTRAPAVLIVGTKADKLPKAKKKAALERLSAELGAAPDAVRPTSAKTGEGIVSLRNAILAIGGLRRKSLDRR